MVIRANITERSRAASAALRAAQSHMDAVRGCGDAAVVRAARLALWTATDESEAALKAARAERAVA